MRWQIDSKALNYDTDTDNELFASFSSCSSKFRLSSTTNSPVVINETKPVFSSFLNTSSNNLAPQANNFVNTNLNSIGKLNQTSGSMRHASNDSVLETEELIVSPIVTEAQPQVEKNIPSEDNKIPLINCLDPPKNMWIFLGENFALKFFQTISQLI